MPFTVGILRLGVAGYVTVVSTNSLSSLIGFHLIVIIFSCYETIVFSPSNVGNFLGNNILRLKIKAMRDL